LKEVRRYQETKTKRKEREGERREGKERNLMKDV
jgi:hypothetical protein